MSKAEEARKGLSEEQIADLKEAFAMFDINGDGKLETRKNTNFHWDIIEGY
jgi:Ca2+-binding EF-hand superfamily protein